MNAQCFSACSVFQSSTSTKKGKPAAAKGAASTKAKKTESKEVIEAELSVSEIDEVQCF